MNPFKGWYWKRKRIRLLAQNLVGRGATSLTGRAGLNKLNLGAGDRPLPGWVNLDCCRHPGIDEVGDVRDLSAIEDASFDIVRASHLFEHFHVNEMPALLGEWTRVLKPGGTLIVCVPDFRGLVLDYLDNATILSPDEWQLPLDAENAIERYSYLAHIFGWNFEHAGEPHMKHHMVFDLRSLSTLLQQNAPLEAVREFDYRKEEPYRLGIDDASTNLWSLNIAATKTV